MSPWQKGQPSPNPLGAALRRPQRGTPLARAVVRLTNIKLERLAIDTTRDSPTVAQAKQLHLQAAKGDLRAIQMIEELSASVSAEAATITQIDIPGTSGANDLVSLINQLYGIHIDGKQGEPASEPKALKESGS